MRLCPACQHHTHLNKSGQRQTQGIGGQMPWEGERNSNALGQGWAFPVEVTELQVQTITLAVQSARNFVGDTTFQAIWKYCTLISSGSSRFLFLDCTTYCWITLKLLSVIARQSTDRIPAGNLMHAQQQLEVTGMNSDACTWQTTLR